MRNLIPKMGDPILFRVKGTEYLSMFRKDESVDISFTKFYFSADNSMFNLVMPEEKQLYVGWTEHVHGK